VKERGGEKDTEGQAHIMADTERPVPSQREGAREGEGEEEGEGERGRGREGERDIRACAERKTRREG
jgi:hypothetical protein